MRTHLAAVSTVSWTTTHAQCARASKLVLVLVLVLESKAL